MTVINGSMNFISVEMEEKIDFQHKIPSDCDLNRTASLRGPLSVGLVYVEVSNCAIE